MARSALLTPPAPPGPAKREKPRFAHESEAEFARILTFYGIHWDYEPRSFPLREQDGQLLEAFTPDFYLPQLDLYVECTVMKQSLTSRKRRKARRAGELAGVQVVLLCRRDFTRLARRWQLERLAVAVGEAAWGFEPPRSG